MTPRLITEADVLDGVAGDPIEIGRGTIITPSALDRARLLGIPVRYGCDLRKSAAPSCAAAAKETSDPAASSSTCDRARDRACDCGSVGGADCACDPPEPVDPPVRADLPVPAASTAPIRKPWSLNFHRRGVDPALFRALTRSGSGDAASDAAPARGASSVGAAGGSRSGSGSSGVLLVSVSGPDAPGRLRQAFDELAPLGAICDLRYRSEVGVLQLVAVVGASREGGANHDRVAGVQTRLERLGLTALIHRT